MSRWLVPLLKVLAFVLWLITVGILLVALIAGMGGVEIPWLDPLESLVGVAIAGIGGLVAWLSARRVERASLLQTVSGNSGAVAQGDRPKAVVLGPGNRGSVAVADIVHQYVLPGEPPPISQAALNAALTQYLNWLAERTGTIELRGVTRAGRTVALALDQVYVPLEATTADEREPEEPGEPEPKHIGGSGTIPRAEPVEITLDRVLTLDRLLVITGGPGCGKTTVLRHIAWVLASAIIADDRAFAEARLGLAGELPLPLYIPLSAFAEHLRPRVAARRRGDRIVDEELRLDTFIPRYLHEHAATEGLPKDFFTRLLERGDQVILLLDGLDEVPNDALRRLVREKVEELAGGRREHMRVVVTCRTAAYQGRTALGKRFQRVVVKPLAFEHVSALVTHAYEDVYRLDPRKRETKTSELLSGIRRLENERNRLNKDSKPLITSPLLVRMLVIVHQRAVSKLPEQRAELYAKATEAMLEPEHALDEDVADQIGRLIGGRMEFHRELSQYLAFHMHSRGKGRDGESVIDEDGLRRILGADPTFAPYIDDYIELTRLRGTLMEELLGSYRFIHLAFQEFLAARYLAEVKRSEHAIADFLEDGPVLDPWWREAALLTPGYLVYTSPTNAQNLLRRLAGVDEGAAARNKTRAGKVQLAAAEIAATAILEWQGGAGDLGRSVAHRLKDLLADEELTAANPLRAAAGVALGRLGDPRPDVASDIPAMVRIPKGKFIMGSERRAGMPGYDDLSKWEDEANPEGTRFEVILPAYRIGKYPVTVAQFRRFVDEGKGYSKEGLWTPEGWAWRRKENITAPRLWDDPQWTVDNHPVVGVSWYEAVAYCAWLRAETGRFFRLPDEAMWEKAARGTDGRRWPWDDKWDASKLNSGESGIGRTSAVGIFPAGRSPYDVYDCAGNVLEWCSGPGYGSGANYPLSRRSYEVASYEEELRLDAGTRALRGGSWDDSDQITRAAFRNDGVPYIRNRYVGFRVVELLSDPES